MTLPVIVLLGLAAGMIVVVRDWRLALFAYGMLSALLAILLTQRIPVEWALLQAIVGDWWALCFFYLHGSCRARIHLASAASSAGRNWLL